MDLKITPQVVAGFKDKDSKKPRFRMLYEKMDFLSAYAEHTNLRVADDPKWAIGRGDEWESHGLLQLEFLRTEGMDSHSTLLDVGCGVGRASRRFVPFLGPGNYVGIDISEAALEHARSLAKSEGWDKQGPLFENNGDLDFTGRSFVVGGHHAVMFDYIWAHSVFTHLPPSQIELMIANAAKLLSAGGKFLFTYKPAAAPQRSGLKQFQYPIEFFTVCAKAAGLTCTPLDYVFPAHQRTIRLQKPLA